MNLNGSHMTRILSALCLDQSISNVVTQVPPQVRSRFLNRKADTNDLL